MNNDTSRTRELPIIPKGTLTLQRSGTTLRVCLNSHGDEITIAHATIPPDSLITDEMMAWAANQATKAGFLATTVTRATDEYYTIDGPTYTNNRLMLTRDASGYQLHDMSVRPGRRIAIGTFDASTPVEQVIDVATRIAREAGYRPIGYWWCATSGVETKHDQWVLAESPVQPYEWQRIQQPPVTPWWKQRHMNLVAPAGAVLTLTGVAGAMITDVWWIAMVGGLATLMLGEAARRWRMRGYRWTCDVCWSRGQRTSIRAASSGELEEMRKAHTDACVNRPHAWS